MRDSRSICERTSLDSPLTTRYFVACEMVVTCSHGVMQESRAPSTSKWQSTIATAVLPASLKRTTPRAWMHTQLITAAVAR